MDCPEKMTDSVEIIIRHFQRSPFAISTVLAMHDFVLICLFEYFLCFVYASVCTKNMRKLSKEKSSNFLTMLKIC